MRADSFITIRSQKSAMSLPPATASPLTFATTGFEQRHNDMKLSVQRRMKR